ncbi:hypothetical protein ACFX2C_041303 [Malus domestica]
MKLKLAKSIDSEQSNGGTNSTSKRSSVWFNQNFLPLQFKQPFRHNQSKLFQHNQRRHCQIFQNNLYQTSSLKGTSKSSKSTSSKKKEKSSQLKDLAQQLMIEVTLLHNEEEDSDSNSSDASLQHPINPASQKTPWEYYQDSQDPFDL